MDGRRLSKEKGVNWQSAGESHVMIVDTAPIFFTFIDGNYTAWMHIAIKAQGGFYAHAFEISFGEEDYKQYQKSGVPSSITIPTPEKRGADSYCL